MTFLANIYNNVNRVWFTAKNFLPNPRWSSVQPSSVQNPVRLIPPWLMVMVDTLLGSPHLREHFKPLNISIGGGRPGCVMGAKSNGINLWFFLKSRMTKNKVITVLKS